jgi:hypothetical protein
LLLRSLQQSALNKLFVRKPSKPQAFSSRQRAGIVTASPGLSSLELQQSDVSDREGTHARRSCPNIHVDSRAIYTFLIQIKRTENRWLKLNSNHEMALQDNSRYFL